ncbi:MAG TPA: hypothetical protein VMF13_19645 [Luteitalea sp.]|nr:hypothetical protein [Luteitalea sp.]
MPLAWGSLITGSIAIWFGGLLSLALLLAVQNTMGVALLLLAWSAQSALLVAMLIANGRWSSPALAGAEAGWRDVEDEDLDDVLEQSFPASDPPSWTSGIARVRTASQTGGRRAAGGLTVGGPWRRPAALPGIQ